MDLNLGSGSVLSLGLIKVMNLNKCLIYNERHVSHIFDPRDSLS